MTKQFKKFIFVFWALIFIPIISLITLLILCSMEVFGPLPKFEDIENPKNSLASEIYSCNQEVYGKYYYENRTTINYDDISPYVYNSLIATEDIRFYEHSGIDFIALLRVANGVITGNRKGGGSTISQQVAKNLFKMRELNNGKKRINIVDKILGTLTMKLKEWIVAVKLEKRYTKDEIIVLYLNTVDFGSKAFGIKTASKIFFNTTPGKLKLEQAATLIGLLRATSYYSPKFNPENSKNRRNVVISQIEKYQDKLNKLGIWDKFSNVQFDSLKNLPLIIDYKRQAHNSGIATYFREYLRQTLTASKPDRANYQRWNEEKYKEDSANWVNNPLYGWCHKNKKPDGTSYNIYEDGLKIYTTIDTRIQKYAEQAVDEHMGKGSNSLQSMFKKRAKNFKNPPFATNLSQNSINTIMYRSIKQSDRYRYYKNELKLDSAQIVNKFKSEKNNMTMFAWNGEIDTNMTAYDSILYNKSFLRAGFMSMEVQTGYVKAYVGGINFNYFKYDHITQAKRQVGSTFKPFVYCMGVMPGGFSPCHKIPNVPISFQIPNGNTTKTYTPKFSSSAHDGQMITLKQGLAGSLNQISAWVMKNVGPAAVVELARQMGITTYLPPVPSLCVGAAEVKLCEMVGAYGTFPNKGIWVEPIFVTRIEDKNGNIISNFKPKINEAMDENTAYRMVDMMRGVIDYGTSTRIRYKYNIKADIAGKTGTTNNNSDGWFIGYTPQLVSGAWVGGEERSIHFKSTKYGQGANMALPIWALFMKKVYADRSLGIKEDIKFETPNFDDGIIIDCSQYEQDTENSNSNYNFDDIEF